MVVLKENKYIYADQKINYYEKHQKTIKRTFKTNKRCRG